MKKIHKYTQRSVEKTDYLNVFLGALIVSQGFYSKTTIQKLSEIEIVRFLKYLHEEYVLRFPYINIFPPLFDI